MKKKYIIKTIVIVSIIVLFTALVSACAIFGNGIQNAEYKNLAKNTAKQTAYEYLLKKYGIETNIVEYRLSTYSKGAYEYYDGYVDVKAQYKTENIYVSFDLERPDDTLTDTYQIDEIKSAIKTYLINTYCLYEPDKYEIRYQSNVKTVSLFDEDAEKTHKKYKNTILTLQNELKELDVVFEYGRNVQLDMIKPFTSDDELFQITKDGEVHINIIDYSTEKNMLAIEEKEKTETTIKAYSDERVCVSNGTEGFSTNYEKYKKYYVDDIEISSNNEIESKILAMVSGEYQALSKIIEIKPKENGNVGIGTLKADENEDGRYLMHYIEIGDKLYLNENAIPIEKEKIMELYSHITKDGEIEKIYYVIVSKK